jgi:hypothetical protein
MIIDARINKVYRNNDGSGRLEIDGQPPLHFDSSPPDVSSLQGTRVWGNAGVIMLGDTSIAAFITYKQIKFVTDKQFSEAIKAYKRD